MDAHIVVNVKDFAVHDQTTETADQPYLQIRMIAKDIPEKKYI